MTILSDCSIEALNETNESRMLDSSSIPSRILDSHVTFLYVCCKLKTWLLQGGNARTPGFHAGWGPRARAPGAAARAAAAAPGV